MKSLQKEYSYSDIKEGDVFMFSVNCKADNYVYIKEDQKVLFFNSIFDDKTWLILLASLLDLLIPDPRSFHIPVAIEVKAVENSIITINNKLEVTGSEDYRYFILNSHYRKWKKTCLISNCILITIAVIMSLFFLYLFFESNKNYLIGILFLVVVSLSIFNISKLINQFKKIKIYGVEDRKIIWTKRDKD